MDAIELTQEQIDALDRVAFMLFVGAHRCSPGGVNSELPATWPEVSETDRQAWREEALAIAAAVVVEQQRGHFSMVVPLATAS